MAEAIQQNQTLSLRISETLRKRLEDIRKLTALRKGESVSTSEIAKQLLESARGDRFETVELLSKPMDAVLEINRGERPLVQRRRSGGKSISPGQRTLSANQGERPLVQRSSGETRLNATLHKAER